MSFAALSEPKGLRAFVDVARGRGGRVQRLHGNHAHRLDLTAGRLVAEARSAYASSGNARPDAGGSNAAGPGAGSRAGADADANTDSNTDANSRPNAGADAGPAATDACADTARNASGAANAGAHSGTRANASTGTDSSADATGANAGTDAARAYSSTDARPNTSDADASTDAALRYGKRDAADRYSCNQQSFSYDAHTRLLENSIDQEIVSRRKRSGGGARRPCATGVCCDHGEPFVKDGGVRRADDGVFDAVAMVSQPGRKAIRLPS